jgi:hypothetical protein
MINNVKTFAERKVKVFDPGIDIKDPMGKAYYLSVKDWFTDDKDITYYFETFLQQPQADKVEALLFGEWLGCAIDRNSSIVIDTLVAAKDILTNLKAVFVGDIPQSKASISWILQSDISLILEAYPNLELLQVRGGEGLQFSQTRHNKLKTLIVETGGLRAVTIADIWNLLRWWKNCLSCRFELLPTIKSKNSRRKMENLIVTVRLQSDSILSNLVLGGAFNGGFNTSLQATLYDTK